MSWLFQIKVSPLKNAIHFKKLFKIKGFFYPKNSLALIVRMRTNRGSTVYLKASKKFNFAALLMIDQIGFVTPLDHCEGVFPTLVYTPYTTIISQKSMANDTETFKCHCSKCIGSLRSTIAAPVRHLTHLGGHTTKLSKPEFRRNG